ncbi:F-box/FBD/LRR-repeat protein At1g13570-like [Capsicum annuum]|nr:F-box/FBD/LRR-repeat protein At1g13570-like [Capsicum annuum]
MAMISRGSKRVYIEGDDLDRLTALPISVKHQIQERLSMEEAARMSILSRPWRHVWSSIPKLIFSSQFCQRKPLIDVIDTILLQHNGAIKTFLLDISSIPPSKHSVIDQWMLLLSRNGIMYLTLQNLQNAAPYILPSCMYDVELESLRLANCIFKPPCSFRGFHKLKSLSLLKVVLLLDNDIAASFLWMPYLVILQVNACSGFPNAKIYAPTLSQVYFLTRRSETLDLGHYMDCRKLKAVRLVSSKENQEKAVNLTYLLNCWSEIRDFAMDSYYLQSFATEAERLPAYLNSLKVMTLYEFDFDDEDQIFSLLRMLIISPNLNDLRLVLSSKKRNVGMEVNVVNHFEGPSYRTLGVLKLESLKVKNFHGSRIEMLFVKFIFASAPSLLKSTIFIEDVESVDQSEYVKITKELMGFPRASPTLKMYMICDASKLGILTQEGSFHDGM